MFESGSTLKAAFGSLMLVISVPALAEDGYRLWLRYDPVEQPLRARYSATLTEVVVRAHGPIAQAARSELERGLSGLLARTVPRTQRVTGDGAIVLAVAGDPELRRLHVPMNDLGDEGFLIRAARVRGHRITLVVSNSERGLLYGSFALLRRIQNRQTLELRDRPRLPL